MAEKNVILKDGEDILYPKTLLSLVDGLPQPTSADNGKMLGVDNGAYALVEGGGGGSGKYQHDIQLVANGFQAYFTFTFINDVATPYTTIANIAADIYQAGYSSNSGYLLSNGIYTQDSTTRYLVMAIYADDSEHLWYTGPRTSDLSSKFGGMMTLTTLDRIWDHVTQL